MHIKLKKDQLRQCYCLHLTAVIDATDRSSSLERRELRVMGGQKKRRRELEERQEHASRQSTHPTGFVRRAESNTLYGCTLRCERFGFEDVRTCTNQLDLECLIVSPPLATRTSHEFAAEHSTVPLMTADYGSGDSDGLKHEGRDDVNEHQFAAMKCAHTLHASIAEQSTVSPPIEASCRHLCDLRLEL
jgi:hypothetical protein